MNLGISGFSITTNYLANPPSIKKLGVYQNRFLSSVSHTNVLDDLIKSVNAGDFLDYELRPEIQESDLEPIEKVLLQMILDMVSTESIGYHVFHVLGIIIQERDTESFLKIVRFLVYHPSFDNKKIFTKKLIDHLCYVNSKKFEPLIKNEIARIMGKEYQDTNVTSLSVLLTPELLKSLFVLTQEMIEPYRKLPLDNAETTIFFACLDLAHASEKSTIDELKLSQAHSLSTHPLLVSRYVASTNFQLYVTAYDHIVAWEKETREPLLDLMPIEEFYLKSFASEEARKVWRVAMYLNSRNTKVCLRACQIIVQKLGLDHLDFIPYANKEERFKEYINKNFGINTSKIFGGQLEAIFDVYCLLGEQEFPLSPPCTTLYDLSEILAKKVSQVPDVLQKNKLYQSVRYLAATLSAPTIADLIDKQLCPSPFFWESDNFKESSKCIKEWEKGQKDLLDLNALWNEKYASYQPQPTERWYWFTRLITLSDDLRADLVLWLIGEGHESIFREVKYGKNVWKPFYKSLEKTVYCKPVLIEKLITKCLSEPQKFKKAVADEMYTDTLYIANQRFNTHNYDIIVEKYLHPHPKRHLKRENSTELEKILTEAVNKPHPRKKINVLPFDIQKQEAQILGRTVVIGTKAYKIGPKKRERSEKADEEAAIFDALKKHKVELGLISDIPEVVGLYEIDELPQNLTDKIKEIGVQLEEKGPFTVLEYDALPGYYKYLNEVTVTEEEFQAGLKKFVYDNAWMIHEGIQLITADIFHDGATDREYLTCVNYWDDRKASAGRLDAFELGVRSPNARLVGGADWSDYREEKQMIEKEQPMRLHVGAGDISSVLKIPEEDRLWKCRAEAIGGLSLVCTLLSITRLERIKGKLDWESKEQQELLISYLKSASEWILESYCRKSKRKNFKDIVNVLCDWEKCAKQIIVWSQNDKKGYLGWLDEHGFLKIPKGLYDTRTEIKGIYPKIIPNYHEKGFMKDGVHRDWGSVNSSLPLNEEEKRWYLLGMVALTAAD